MEIADEFKFAFFGATSIRKNEIFYEPLHFIIVCCRMFSTAWGAAISTSFLVETTGTFNRTNFT